MKLMGMAFIQFLEKEKAKGYSDRCHHTATLDIDF